MIRGIFHSLKRHFSRFTEWEKNCVLTLNKLQGTFENEMEKIVEE